VYFFVGSMVIGGSLDQLAGLLDEADVEAESASEAEAVSEDETGDESDSETVLPEDGGNVDAELTVPVEAQPDSSSSPAAAVAMPKPIL